MAAFPGANALTSIEVDANNGNYASVDGVFVYEGIIPHLIAYPRTRWPLAAVLMEPPTSMSTRSDASGHFRNAAFLTAESAITP